MRGAGRAGRVARAGWRGPRRAIATRTARCWTTSDPRCWRTSAGDSSIHRRSTTCTRRCSWPFTCRGTPTSQATPRAVVFAIAGRRARASAPRGTRRRSARARRRGRRPAALPVEVKGRHTPRSGSIRPPPATAAGSARAPARRAGFSVDVAATRAGTTTGTFRMRVHRAYESVACALLRLTAIARPGAPEQREATSVPSSAGARWAIRR